MNQPWVFFLHQIVLDIRRKTEGFFAVTESGRPAQIRQLAPFSMR
jgi:hypothetical protein